MNSIQDTLAQINSANNRHIVALSESTWISNLGLDYSRVTIALSDNTIWQSKNGSPWKQMPAIPLPYAVSVEQLND